MNTPFTTAPSTATILPDPAVAPTDAGTTVRVDHVLTLDCPEAPGILHAVTGFIERSGCDIVENAQFGDRRHEHFFLRVRITSLAGPADTEVLRRDFAPLAERFRMDWRISPASVPRRVVIMVSRFDHCLNDLLYRVRTGSLPVQVVAVVSNHLDHRALVEWHGIPFVHLPVTPETKQEAEAALLELVDTRDVDLVVLARYMQVLSDDLCKALEGRAINIHHSFLPSFKGAKPYHQAYRRGVKLVGATAHYVTADLDEGPIIAQQVVAVDHTHGPEELVAIGRDAEATALARAVRWHCEGRVVIHGNRTVVLR